MLAQGSFLFLIWCGHEGSHLLLLRHYRCLELQYWELFFVKQSLLCNILFCVTPLHYIFSLFSVLQLFCSSPKPVLRYAAVRTLNKVSTSKAF